MSREGPPAFRVQGHQTLPIIPHRPGQQPLNVDIPQWAALCLCCVLDPHAQGRLASLHRLVLGLPTWVPTASAAVGRVWKTTQVSWGLSGRLAPCPGPAAHPGYGHWGLATARRPGSAPSRHGRRGSPEAWVQGASCTAVCWQGAGHCEDSPRQCSSYRAPSAVEPHCIFPGTANHPAPRPRPPMPRCVGGLFPSSPFLFFF